MVTCGAVRPRPTTLITPRLFRPSPLAAAPHNRTPSSSHPQRRRTWKSRGSCRRTAQCRTSHCCTRFPHRLRRAAPAALRPTAAAREARRALPRAHCSRAGGGPARTAAAANTVAHRRHASREGDKVLVAVRPVVVWAAAAAFAGERAQLARGYSREAPRLSRGRPIPSRHNFTRKNGRGIHRCYAYQRIFLFFFYRPQNKHAVDAINTPTDTPRRMQRHVVYHRIHPGQRSHFSRSQFSVGSLYTF